MPLDNSNDELSDQAGPTLRNRLASLGAVARTVPGWALKNRLKASLLGGSCLASVIVVVAVWLMLASAHNQAPTQATYREALDALDRGAYVEARQLAKKVIGRVELPLDKLGGPSFVLGAAACHEGDDTWSNEKTNYYLLAARYLEEARDLGFPPGREAEGMFLLGKSLYLSGRIPGGRLVLRESLTVDQPTKTKTEIYRLLAGACLNDANPKLREALKYNTQYLSDRMLPPGQRHQGLLERALILLRLNDIPQSWPRWTRSHRKRRIGPKR